MKIGESTILSVDRCGFSPVPTEAMSQPKLSDPRLRKNNGRFYACFYDSRKKQEKWVSLKTTRRRAAERRIAEVRRMFDRGDFDPYEDKFRTGTDLRTALEEWINDHPSWSDRSANLHRSTISNFIQWIGPPTMTGQVRPEHIRGYLEDRDLAQNTKSTYYFRLDRFFRWLKEEKYIQESPLKDIDQVSRSSDGEKPFLSRDEVDQIQIAIQHHYEELLQRGKTHGRGLMWLADMIEVAVYTGLRVGELCHQRWLDTTLGSGPEDSVFLVRSYENEERSFRVKGDKSRRVPLSEKIIPILERMRESQIERGVYSEESTVFKGPRSESAFHYSYPSRKFREFRKVALPHRPEISFHNLRHTCASWMVQNGVALYRVKQMLGHAKYETTLQYAHLAPDSVPAAVRKAFDSG